MDYAGQVGENFPLAAAILAYFWPINAVQFHCYFRSDFRRQAHDICLRWPDRHILTWKLHWVHNVFWYCDLFTEYTMYVQCIHLFIRLLWVLAVSKLHGPMRPGLAVQVSSLFWPFCKLFMCLSGPAFCDHFVFVCGRWQTREKIGLE